MSRSHRVIETRSHYFGDGVIRESLRFRIVREPEEGTIWREVCTAPTRESAELICDLLNAEEPDEPPLGA